MSSQLREHAILVDRDGRSLHPDGEYAKSPERSEEVTQHIASITNAIVRSGKKDILIYVHGGLNTANGSLNKTSELISQITAGSDSYPLFINWRSGLWSSYGEHLFTIRQGKAVPFWQGLLTSPFYLTADIGRAVTRAPITWYYQLANDLSTSRRFGALWVLDGHKRHHRPAGASDSPSMSQGADKRGLGAQSWHALKWVATSPLKYALAPLVDSLGRSAWDNMSRRTHTMFRETQKPAGVDFMDDAEADFGRAPDGAVSTWSDALTKLFSGTNAYTVTVVGHSMGTMVLNELIRTNPDWPCTNIVYMAMPL